MNLFKDRMGNSLTFSQAWPKIKNRLLNYQLDFNLMILRWVGHLPSHMARNAIYRLAGIKIGKRSTIHIGARFFEPRNITIGNGSIIGDHVFMDGRAPLHIGDNVDIASEVMIYNSEHDIESADFRATVDEVVIGDYVFIGPRTIILPGVKIGNGAVVAASAVVTKDVKDFQIVGGVPAVVIGERKLRNLSYKLGRARLFQ